MLNISAKEARSLVEASIDNIETDGILKEIQNTIRNRASIGLICYVYIIPNNINQKTYNRITQSLKYQLLQTN